MRTADEYRACVLALRHAAEGKWKVEEVIQDHGTGPYAYATLRAEPSREDAGHVMLGFVEVALAVNGYLTMSTFPSSDHVAIQVSVSGPAAAIDHEVRT